MNNLTRRERIKQQLDSSDRWECVLFTSRGDLPYFGSLQSDSRFVAVIDGRALASELRLFQELKAAFQFPDYFGNNWDALADCLGDLEWIPAEAYLLVVDDVAANGLTRSLAELLEVWLSAAQEWSTRGTPFHLVGLLRD